jgi:molybdopterin/thiamine biosynthesis adenylyltransferase
MLNMTDNFGWFQFYKYWTYFGRLWGEEGQTRLENAKVCLLRATATGCEALKNLVLPGIKFVGLFLILKAKVLDISPLLMEK